MKRVAVIGGGLGGMTAAGELARLGHAVTLFERGHSLGGKAQLLGEGAVPVDVGPTLLTLPHVVREGFRRLDAEDLLPRLIELEHQSHTRFHDGKTFDVWRDLERTVASAEALQAGEGEAVRRFYAEAAEVHRAAGEPYLDAPFEGAFEYLTRVARRGLGLLWKGSRLGTLQAFAEACFKSPHLQKFAGRFATYAGASPYEASAAFALVPHIERAFGVHHVEGGMGALSAALAKALARLGVQTRLGVEASWQPWRTGFAVGPTSDQTHYDAVVVNADPLASLGREHERLALSGYVLLLDAPDVKLPHHAVSFAADYAAEFQALFEGRVADDVTFYVCHAAATDPSMRVAERSGLLVMVNVHPLVYGADFATLGPKLRARCLAHVRELGVRDARVIGERTPVDFANAGAPKGSIYGFLPHGRFGPFRRPRIRSRTRGLFYSGGGTHPGGGVPLVMLSGHFAAQLAAESLGAGA
ncbi:MAG: NAD(P)-binding protein [Myxococcaceae bacterium]|nr:NAD(P)-binding protein [Myxococcaceae bacterium]